MSKAVKSMTDMQRLKALTPARIGLSRAGTSLATREVLAFDLDHARARDAVHLPFNVKDIEDALHLRNLITLRVSSAAVDRATYLQRPDLGRQLNEPDVKRLAEYQANAVASCDLAIIVADGLSTRAIHENAVTFLDTFLPLAEKHGWRQAPIVIASQARVAIADEIGDLLAARLSIILIGERPGLSAADSMGIYVTFAPRKGRTDAERNCLSNIRPAGLALSEAGRQLERLILSAFDQGVTGVALKQ